MESPSSQSTDNIVLQFIEKVNKYSVQKKKTEKIMAKLKSQRLSAIPHPIFHRKPGTALSHFPKKSLINNNSQKKIDHFPTKPSEVETDNIIGLKNRIKQSVITPQPVITNTFATIDNTKKNPHFMPSPFSAHSPISPITHPESIIIKDESQLQFLFNSPCKTSPPMTRPLLSLETVCRFDDEMPSPGSPNKISTTVFKDQKIQGFIIFDELKVLLEKVTQFKFELQHGINVFF